MNDSTTTQAPLQVDRIACSAHGVCAKLLPRAMTLDAHGYPIVHDALVDVADGDLAITMCPARALYWKGR